ncbi:MAG: TMEM165/GDT1 family protein [Rhodospirillales bacterium]|nr:TMEM165/GDT1 family protein [Rhodospirillales bacterium]
MMEILLKSTGLVALGEIGDKTQLLALLLAARFRKPIPIILGILVATLANHTAAGALGAWVRDVLGPDFLRWGVGLSFLALAAWTLKPDEADEGEARPLDRYGAFVATTVTFFLAEIGDKTQIATIALAAHYENLPMVVAGTTIGMLLADVPAVFLGNLAADRIPFRLVRGIAAALFAVMGAGALLGGAVSFNL